MNASSHSAFSVDAVVLGVPDVSAASAFHSAMFTGGGAMSLEFRPDSELDRSAGLRAALAAITPGPSGVTAIIAAAEKAGARVIKPAKKQLFGEFAGSVRAPDGSLWKLAAASKRDPRGDAGSASQATTETAVYLAVASPKTSKKFYEALGMTTEHDYGDTFVDFTVSGGRSRLGLIPVKGLAKDLGISGDEPATGCPGVALRHNAGSRKAVDALVAAAESAGGSVISAPGTDDSVGAVVADPDGHRLVIYPV